MKLFVSEDVTELKMGNKKYLNLEIDNEYEKGPVAKVVLCVDFFPVFIWSR